jgi:hypothetical protein
MKKFLSFQPKGTAAPDGPQPDSEASGRPMQHERILGQRDAERAEQHIAVLRQFTDFALETAKRLNDREADKAGCAAARDGETRLAEPAAEAEISLALHRLSRIAQLNIALEQKLVEALRSPEPGNHAPQRTHAAAKQAAQDAHLAAQKEAVQDFVEEWAPADPKLDRAQVDELMAELRRGLDSGGLDEKLLAEDARTVGFLFMIDHRIEPNYCDFPIKGPIVEPATLPDGTGPP